MNLQNTMISEKSQSYKTTYIVWFNLYEVCRMGKCVETKSWLTRAGGREEWVMAARNTEKTPKLDDDHTTLNIRKCM